MKIDFDLALILLIGLDIVSISVYFIHLDWVPAWTLSHIWFMVAYWSRNSLQLYTD